MLLKFRTGNNKPIIQIERKYRLHRLVHMTHAPRNSVIRPWIQALWTKSHPVVKYNERLQFSAGYQLEFEHGVIGTEFSILNKVHFNGFNFCTKSTCENCQYDDSWICKNGIFYNIENILSDKQDCPYFVGRELVVEKVYDNVYKYEESNVTRIVKFDSSVIQCISMTINKEGDLIRFLAKCKVITQND